MNFVNRCPMQKFKICQILNGNLRWPLVHTHSMDPNLVFRKHGWKRLLYMVYFMFVQLTCGQTKTLISVSVNASKQFTFSYYSGLENDTTMLLVSKCSYSHVKNIKGPYADHILIPQAQPEVVYFLVSNESPYFANCKSEISPSNSL